MILPPDIKVDPKTHHVYSADGYWLPPICAKQYEVLVAGERYLLISGPRLSGKTEAILHKVLKHAYDNPGARIAIFAKTTKTGKSGGVWQDLTSRIIPIWKAAGFGFKLLQEPKVTGDTRQNMFIVQSRDGRPSEVMLHSLEYAPEVDEKLRGTKWSMIWFSEIDQIAPESGPEPEIRDDRSVFAAADAQLRMEPYIPTEAHQIIMDCNPPEDAEDHWLYRLFEIEKNDKSKDALWRDNLRHMQFSIEDNPFLTKERKIGLFNSYAYRQSLLDRLYYGKWTKDTTVGHFSHMFNPEIHVMPDPQSAAEGNVIVPTPAVKVLLSSLDLGDKNNAFVIGEKLEVKEPDGKIITKFAILDEMVITGREMPIRVWVEGMMTMISKWEKYCKETYGRTVKWRHWSDEAAWHYKQVAEAMDYLVVRNLSGDKINLRPAPKYAGSIRDRVQLLQQLLFENRIYFSAQLESCLTMLRTVKKGKSAADYVAPPRQTHIFDALTYLLHSEAPVDEVTFSDVKTAQAPSRLVLMH